MIYNNTQSSQMYTSYYNAKLVESASIILTHAADQQKLAMICDLLTAIVNRSISASDQIDIKSIASITKTLAKYYASLAQVNEQLTKYSYQCVAVACRNMHIIANNSAGILYNVISNDQLLADAAQALVVINTHTQDMIKRQTINNIAEFWNGIVIR